MVDNDLGIGLDSITEQPKRKPKEFKVEEWDVKKIKQKLMTNAQLKKSPAEIAVQYGMTWKNFRVKCFGEPELANWLIINNEAYARKIFDMALSSGKHNSYTDDFLRSEIQIFSSTGAEQIVNFYEVESDFELDVDINIKKTPKKSGMQTYQKLMQKNDKLNK